MSESQSKTDRDVTLPKTEGGNADNFDTMERVFTRALANVDDEIRQVGGFGRVLEIDRGKNMVHVEFARSTFEDPERRWITAHGVETVNREEYPTYAVNPDAEAHR